MKQLFYTLKAIIVGGISLISIASFAMHEDMSIVPQEPATLEKAPISDINMSHSLIHAIMHNNFIVDTDSSTILFKDYDNSSSTYICPIIKTAAFFAHFNKEALLNPSVRSSKLIDDYIIFKSGTDISLCNIDLYAIKKNRMNLINNLCTVENRTQEYDQELSRISKLPIKFFVQNSTDLPRRRIGINKKSKKKNSVNPTVKKFVKEVLILNQL